MGVERGADPDEGVAEDGEEGEEASEEDGGVEGNAFFDGEGVLNRSVVDVEFALESRDAIDQGEDEEERESHDPVCGVARSASLQSIFDAIPSSRRLLAPSDSPSYSPPTRTDPTDAPSRPLERERRRAHLERRKRTALSGASAPSESHPHAAAPRAIG